MFWEELTGDRFAQAVKKVQGVCLLPLACIERHGHHLPLGTDMYIARELCRRAAALEPALIFPDVIFTQILEARHQPGTIAVEPELMLGLLENVCQEIARNGLHKIVIVNAHGGNNNLVGFFAQIQLSRWRDYTVYVAEPPLQGDDAELVAAQWQTTIDGHAGENETSQIMAIRPELVHPDVIPTEPEGMPPGRLQGLQELGVTTGIWWYADHPTHYCGDGQAGTAEKGERYLDASARAIAAAVKAIKQDEETRRLQDEFYDAADGH